MTHDFQRQQPNRHQARQTHKAFFVRRAATGGIQAHSNNNNNSNMPYVGNLTTVRDKESCYKDYQVVQETAKYYSTQNAWTAMHAETYVSQLLLEAPRDETLLVVAGQLAVVTGVTTGSVGFHVAQELALQTGMHVVLMGRSAGHLRRCAADIRAEAMQRGLGLDIPICLYGCKFHLASLDSVQEAADYVTSLANEKYQGKLHILVNHASVGSPHAKLTMDKQMEYNTGCNFVATHHFTKLLIPLLQKAAVVASSGSTDKDKVVVVYKPRVIFTASMGHALGTNFHPHRLVQHPKEGGAPPGYIIVVDENTIREYEPPASIIAEDDQEQQDVQDGNDSSPIAAHDDATAATATSMSTITSRLYQMTKAAIARQKSIAAAAAATRAAVATAGTQVGRSKMALVADAVYFAHLYPEINFTSHHPGAIFQNSTSAIATTTTSLSSLPVLSIVMDKMVFRLLSPSQGARAALRAALDPDFNQNDFPDLQHGAYLHADGNPWTYMMPSASSVLNPNTRQPYKSMLEFGKACHEAADALIAQIMSTKQQQQQIANVRVTTTTTAPSSAPLAATVNVNHDVQQKDETAAETSTPTTCSIAGESNTILQVYSQPDENEDTKQEPTI